jgi:hypothetical protein
MNNSLQDLEGEIWKDIIGFEGYYKVSNMGRVKSLFRVVNKSNGRIMTFQSKILSLNKHYKNGYYSVCLRFFDKVKRLSVHRLVGKYFLEPIKNKNEINHIDNDKSNNRYDNLEWVNRAENQCYFYKDKSKTSKYSGVYLSKDTKKRKYIAHICHNAKKIRLGRFETEEEAYKARKQFELDNNIINKYS